MFEAGESLNRFAQGVCRGGFCRGPLRNPVVTSLLITVLALVIVFAIACPGAGWRVRLKAGVYTWLAVALLLFLHYYAMREAFGRRAENAGIRAVADNVGDLATAKLGGWTEPLFRTDETRLGKPACAECPDTGVLEQLHQFVAPK